MKFFFIIIIIFSFQSLVKSDEINDFDIEGFSIGTSLLNFMTEKEIKASKKYYEKNGYPKNKRYYTVGYDKLEIYEGLDIYLKRGDNKYIIRTISGFLFINKNKCLLKKAEIVGELRSIFSNTKEVTYEDVPHSYDLTGETKQFQTAFLIENDELKDHIRVECTDWSKKLEKKWADNLSVAAFSSEVLKWMADGYN